MSFLDLATLTSHRRSELEARINVLANKCDQAVASVNRIKLQGQGFVGRLNCEPSELKDRFLDCMRQLDEYIYLITDFNLAVEQFDTASQEQLPVHDVTPKQLMPTKVHPPHLLDVLSEARPSTSTACANQCTPARTKPKRKSIPKEDVLIEFSSSSCSQESFLDREKEVQYEVSPLAISNLTLKDPEVAPAAAVPKWPLPAQSTLQTDIVYQGYIVHVDGVCIWIITETLHEMYKMMTKIREYYQGNKVLLTWDEVASLTYSYCYVYEEDGNTCYRCLLIKLIEDDKMAEVFLVDTGEVHYAPIEIIQPLPKEFCDRPPYARCCHLAGVELIDRLLEKQQEFLRRFLGQQCQVQVDDNTSESLGVYIGLQTKQLLNQLVVQEGLAISTEKITEAQPVPAATEVAGGGVRGPPEMVPDEDFDLNVDGPEYEDPLEAVTGYHNRDEAEICKHYKGGPEKTCFKGARCKKRHTVMHPKGWTLDKVEVTGNGKPMPLPAPGTWHKVKVTSVGLFDQVHFQFIGNKVEEQKRSFGEVLPPMTLSSLIRDMNSPAARVAYQPLKLAPSPGEVVAALYPPDQQWYRAFVISHSGTDRCVEVRYVDYGNESWVTENNIRQLDPMLLVLPFQAVKAKLAGVIAKSQDPAQWVKAKRALETLVLDKELNAHVIARHYDELEIELYDKDGYSVAEKLFAQGEVALCDVNVEQGGRAPDQQVVVP